MSESDQVLSDGQWQSLGVERCRRALSDACSAGDRLALLRSLTRLQGGRLDLDRESVCLSPEEVSMLSRFGLALGTNVLRIVQEQDSRAPEGFWAAEALDTAPRRIQREYSPDAALLRHTSYQTYRTAAQKAGVRALLTMPPRGGLMVCMPTGSGKSLLFQLDALHGRSLEPASCIAVITPTVALALDHARTLSTVPGLERSRALTGDLKGRDRDDLLNEFRRGEIPILLLSPEIALGAARDVLLEAATPAGAKYASLKANLRTLVIDEAHIVESWGRSFRPDFQRLPALVAELRQLNPDLNVVLLSATLPPAARQVLRHAYVSSGPWLEIDAGTPRYEFDVVVQSYDTSAERQAALDFVIDRAPRPMIIYTTLAVEPDSGNGNRDNERISAEELYERLIERQYKRIALFTGQITNGDERHQIVEDWAAERIDIVVATSAFGMGVDKSNVRTVVHACLPEGPSRWYQEIGRAARDGHQGLAVCLFTRDERWTTRNDVKDAFSQATGSWLTRELAELRWRALLDRRSGVRWSGSSQQMRLDLNAAREGLRTRAANDYNRTWNMSLLNLMQRAGVLEVLSVNTESGDEASWEIEIRDPAILSESDIGVWDLIFKLRDAEQGTARAELDIFVRLMTSPDEHCIIRDVFELIEEKTIDGIEQCGRCPACRARAQHPPRTIHCQGLEGAWPCSGDAGPVELPAGTTLVVPEDPTYETGLDRLVQRLAAAGFEQFVVPDDLAPAIALILAQSTAELGFVLGHEALTGDVAATLAYLPTAVFMPTNESVAARLLLYCRQWLTAAPHIPVAIISSSERCISERRLDQTVSSRAPYMEDVLDAFVTRTREAR